VASIDTTTYSLAGAGMVLCWHVKPSLHTTGHKYAGISVGDRFSLDQTKGAIGNPPHLLHLADDTRDRWHEYRSHVPTFALPVTKHKDNRDSFGEMARSWRATGQSSFSATGVGITCGNHYHRAKVEPFVTVVAKASLARRKMFSDRVITILVDGDPISGRSTDRMDSQSHERRGRHSSHTFGPTTSSIQATPTRIRSRYDI
jgi:hypothetical protein